MEINQFVFASHNPGKAIEVNKTVAALGYAVLPLNLIEAQFGPAPHPEETADTYEGNARIKSQAFFSWCGVASLADDAGLEVFALSGEPGVVSAHYAGQGASSKQNMDKLLLVMDGVTDRRARFISQLFLTTAKGVFLERAALNGRIEAAPRGSGGFGYDALFVPDGEALTLAEIKAKGSADYPTHRVLALRALFARGDVRAAISGSVSQSPS